MSTFALPQEYPTLESDRLILRPFTKDDTDTIHRLLSFPHMSDDTPKLPQANPEYIAEKWISQYDALWANGIELNLAVIKRETNALVGGQCLRFDSINQSATLSYWTGYPFWNNGFATEATQTLVQFAFQTLHLNRIEAHCLMRNDPSIRVLEHNHFLPEGVQRQAIQHNQRFEDVAYYGLLINDYR